LQAVAVVVARQVVGQEGQEELVEEQLAEPVARVMEAVLLVDKEVHKWLEVLQVEGVVAVPVQQVLSDLVVQAQIPVVGQAVELAEVVVGIMVVVQATYAGVVMVEVEDLHTLWAWVVVQQQVV